MTNDPNFQVGQRILENVRAGRDIIIGKIIQIFIHWNNTPKPTGFPQNIPTSSTDEFVGRDQELERLHQQLQRNHSEVIAAVVEGMGGVGKTELAIQYSLLNLKSGTYPGGICWLRARKEDMGWQIVQFAQTDLGLQPPNDLELPERVRWCWQHWHKGNTLLVMDDVKNYSDIEPYLPPQLSQFKVLITTRLKLNLASSLFLSVLHESDALKLLAQLIGKEKKNQKSAQAQELCQRLGYLPLALQLVGRRVKKDRISLTTMLQLLEEKGLGHPSLEVDENDPTWTLNIKQGVAAAFEMSWQELSDQAQQLGCLLSLFALAPIPWDLVEKVMNEQSSEALKNARVKLENLYLFVGEDDCQLHQLIREFLRNKQNNLASAHVQKSIFCQAMVEMAKKIRDTSTFQENTEFTSSIPHLIEAATVYRRWLRDEDFIAPFMGLAYFYKSQIAYNEAISWCEECLNATRERFGEDHLNVATSLHNLAYLYESQGRYVEAESHLLEALDIRNCQLGENHPDVAQSLNTLGAIHYSQGRYVEAESFWRRSLYIRRRKWGENHPDVAQSLNNLALVYISLGWYDEAEDCYQRALRLRQSLQGENRLCVAASLNTLAQVYHFQKRYPEAENFFNQSLQLLKEVLSDKHPEVALVLNNLALLYCSQKRYKKAGLLYKQAIQIQEDKLGNEHPHLAISFYNLASVYIAQRHYFKAKYLLEKSLKIRQNILSNNHPDLAANRKELAELDYLKNCLFPSLFFGLKTSLFHLLGYHYY
ncbi:MAG: tetratricopeptide repeat protein [Brasilonema angustatum HA4187-MV1]|jgi:tetratricopeptide (TPR) repeat protein|nr:tetratricopeptide repeat protein [Brasilonema angustatum HA4187-MV1]